jgi:hypothetical protein
MVSGIADRFCPSYLTTSSYNVRASKAESPLHRLTMLSATATVTVIHNCFGCHKFTVIATLIEIFLSSFQPTHFNQPTSQSGIGPTCAAKTVTTCEFPPPHSFIGPGWSVGRRRGLSGTSPTSGMRSSQPRRRDRLSHRLCPLQKGKNQVALFMLYLYGPTLPRPKPRS